MPVLSPQPNKTRLLECVVTSTSSILQPSILLNTELYALLSSIEHERLVRLRACALRSGQLEVLLDA
jgi:hypothetical protein